MGLKFGKAVTMIVERYGWSAFDNLNAINDPDLCKAVEMVRRSGRKRTIYMRIKLVQTCAVHVRHARKSRKWLIRE